jgi:predicted lipid carrier protein YhbT
MKSQSLAPFDLTSLLGIVGIPSPLALLPQPVTAVSLGVTLNLFFTRYPDLKRRMQELAGKVFRFHVEDLGQEFYMTVDSLGDVRIHTYSDEFPSVTMEGSSHAFLALLLNRSDPDSLFFSRELNMSGETDTGLHFKNILDNVEIDWERELGAWLGGTPARIAMAAFQRIQQARARLHERLEAKAEVWMETERIPRRTTVDILREETAALNQTLDRLEHSITRCAHRINRLSSSPAPASGTAE